MFSWIVATVLAVGAWLAATLYLWVVRRRENETSAGLNALAGLHWRDFSRMVRRAMREQRDLHDAVADEDVFQEPQSDFVMTRGDARWLLSCKHGRAYRIGSAAVNELGATARLMGAQGGILVTEGTVQRDGIAAAEKQSVEILDGRRIWPMLKRYLPSELEDGVIGASRRRAQRHTVIAALAAVTLGLLVGLGGLALQQRSTDAASIAALPAPAQPKPAAAPPAPSASPAAATGPSAAPVSEPEPAASAAPDPATEAGYRQSVSKALAKTPGVIRGIWQTRMTLVIDRRDDDAQVWPRICKEVERYPSLRTARIQLNPRPDRDEPVRWRQCRTF
ncbi:MULTISPECIES: restriction endonuclease [Xanthomonas translucens group]|uniref:restriction endonuclease n=1 Tax=Xanthomonas translucens group TaxID=3390202 RepID=UPI000579295B|nr:restriction endonuclease [Xanthomonas translucens]UKE45712.1 restriction endonuclease [Xanthomonas translucens pv. cerealis]